MIEITESYLERIEKSLPSSANRNYTKWKRYASSGIERGLILKGIISKFAPIDGAKILDVGSGDGGISIAFGKSNQTEVIGIDLNSARVKTSIIGAKEEKAASDFLVANGSNLPFKQCFFDIIICNDVIEHVQNPKKLLSELHRSLRDGGVLYICAPNGFSPYSIIRDAHYGIFGLSLMPYNIGKFYVTKIRKISQEYDVYGPFNYWLLKRLLGSLFSVIDCYQEQPTKVKKLIQVLPNIVLKLLFPTISLICKKDVTAGPIREISLES